MVHSRKYELDDKQEDGSVVKFFDLSVKKLY